AAEVFEGPDVAVGDDGGTELVADFADGGPVDGRIVALDPRAGVDGEPGRSAFGGHGGIFVGRVGLIPTQPKVRRDGDFGWDGLADGGDDVADAAGGFEEGGSAVVSIHGGSRAAEIDVDAGGSGFDGVEGRLGHVFGVAAEDLDLDGEAGGL